MSTSIYALHAALRDMDTGDVRTFSYPDMRTTEVVSEAKSFSRRHGFSVKYSAGYGGVDVTKQANTFRSTAERAIIAMASGQTIELPTGGLEIPTVRELIHKINKTEAVRVDAELSGRTMRITRTDLSTDAPPIRYNFDPVVRTGAGVFFLPLKPALRQKQFEADLWLFSLIAHQPMGSLRISDTEVEAYRL